MTKARLEAWAPYPQSDKHRRAKEKEQIGKEWTRVGTLVVPAIGLMIFCLLAVSWITFLFGWHVPVILVLIVSKVILIVAGVKRIED